jgi:dTDP-4-dehydrorhamnose 3,5-epimerase
VRIRETGIAGVVVGSFEPVRDERGAFERMWDGAALAEHGIDPLVTQCSLARNDRAGTLRGLHWQDGPEPETKVVRCVRGAIFDVAADVRPGSETYGRWFGLRLHADGNEMLIVPPGCAHGYVTLEDASDVAYWISAPYRPSAARGVRYDDPRLAIAWPLQPVVMSARDRSLPPLP